MKSDPKQPSNVRLSFAALAAAFLAALFLHNSLQTFSAVHALYLTVPYQDYWRVAYHLHDIQSFHFAYLWQQHNEHRIVFPDIVYALDVLLFHMRRILPLAVSCACYLASWFTFVAPALRDPRFRPLHRLVIGLTPGIVIAWKGSALSLADPFLLQWTLLSFAALLALALLPRSTSAAILCAVVATYSSGSGLFLWPVLWLAARFLRLPRRAFLALLLSGCFFLALYFVGYRFSSAGSLANLWRHPLYEAGFVLMFFSMPFGGMKSAHFGLWIGALHLLAALSLAPVLLRTRCRLSLVLCGWYLFVFLSALSIAAGRMDFSDPTFTAAKATRYLVPVMLCWGALFALLPAAAALRRWRIASPPLLAVLLALLLLLANQKLRWWWTINLRPWIAAQIAEVSLENNVFDPALTRALFPSHDFVIHYLADLKQAHLSIYSHPSPLGPPAPSAVTPLAIYRTLPVENALEVIGVAPSPSTSVFLLDSNRIVIGTGRTLAFGLPSELMPPQTAPSRAWIAFLPASHPAAPFQAVARSRSRE